MSELTILANIHAYPERVEQVKVALEKLLPLTRAEAGCLQYDLLHDNRDPAHFMVFERWATPALLQAHTNSAHLAAFRCATEGAVTAFTLNEMTRIG